MTDRDPVKKPVPVNMFGQFADTGDEYNWVRATCMVWNEVAVVHPKYHTKEAMTAGERLSLQSVNALVNYAMSIMNLESRIACWYVSGLYPKFEFYIQEKDGSATRIAQE